MSDIDAYHIIKEMINKARNNPALAEITEHIEILEINLETLSKNNTEALLFHAIRLLKLKDMQIQSLNELMFIKGEQIETLKGEQRQKIVIYECPKCKSREINAWGDLSVELNRNKIHSIQSLKGFECLDCKFTEEWIKADGNPILSDLELDWMIPDIRAEHTREIENR